MAGFLFGGYLAVIEAASKLGSKLLVSDFYAKHAQELGLELLAGQEGVSRLISVPEVERPGLSLAAGLKASAQRILLFGRAEMLFLKKLPVEKRSHLLNGILFETTPFVLVSRNLHPCQELIEVCDEKMVPLIRSHLPAMQLMAMLFYILSDLQAQTLSCHGSLVEIFGLGVLIQGEAAVGKSEAALGLIERGHRLVADDLVILKKNGVSLLEGYGAKTSRYQMEIKGIGIINIAHLYGIRSVCEKKSLDIVVKLEVWNDSHFYDHNGLKENTISFMGIEVPFFSIQMKPGRNTVLLLETIALTHRLKILPEREQQGKAWSSL